MRLSGLAALVLLSVVPVQGHANQRPARSSVVPSSSRKQPGLSAPRANARTRDAWRDTLRRAAARAPGLSQVARYQQARTLAPTLIRALDIPVGSARREAEAEATYVLARRVFRMSSPHLLNASRRDAQRARRDEGAQRLYCYAAGTVPTVALSSVDRKRWSRSECADRAASVLRTWRQLLATVMVEPPRR